MTLLLLILACAGGDDDTASGGEAPELGPASACWILDAQDLTDSSQVHILQADPATGQVDRIATAPSWFGAGEVDNLSRGPGGALLASSGASPSAASLDLGFDPPIASTNQRFSGVSSDGSSVLAHASDDEATQWRLYASWDALMADGDHTVTSLPDSEAERTTLAGSTVYGMASSGDTVLRYGLGSTATDTIDLGTDPALTWGVSHLDGHLYILVADYQTDRCRLDVYALPDASSTTAEWVGSVDLDSPKAQYARGLHCEG